MKNRSQRLLVLITELSYCWQTPRLGFDIDLDWLFWLLGGSLLWRTLDYLGLFRFLRFFGHLARRLTVPALIAFDDITQVIGKMDFRVKNR